MGLRRAFVGGLLDVEADRDEGGCRGVPNEVITFLINWRNSSTIIMYGREGGTPKILSPTYDWGRESGSETKYSRILGREELLCSRSFSLNKHGFTA